MNLPSVPKHAPTEDRPGAREDDVPVADVEASPAGATFGRRAQRAQKIHPEDDEREHFTRPKFRDIGFAAFFWLCFLWVLVSAVTRGVPEYRIAVADAEREEAEENEFRDRHSASGDEHEEGGVGRSDARFMFAVCVLVSLGPGGSALAAFEVALHNPEAMIYYGLYCTVAMCFIMLLINIALGSILGSLFWLLLTGLMVCYAYMVRDRIPFAAANLSLATKAVEPHKEPIVCVAFSGLATQVLWIVLWLFAVFGYCLHNVRARQASMPDPSPEYEAHESRHHDESFEAYRLRDDDGESSGALPGLGVLDTAYYGLGDGCRTLLLHNATMNGLLLARAANQAGPAPANPTSAAASDQENDAWDDDGSGAIGVYCGCESGTRLYPGECDLGRKMIGEFGAHFFIYFILFILLYWGGKVVAGVVHVTSSGVVAAWWFGASAYANEETAPYAYAQVMTHGTQGTHPGFCLSSKAHARGGGASKQRYLRQERPHV